MGPGADYSIFTSLGCFALTYFFLTILSSTLPIPSGIFGPSFVLGAAVGRAMGELVACWYPEVSASFFYISARLERGKMVFRG